MSLDCEICRGEVEALDRVSLFDTEESTKDEATARRRADLYALATPLFFLGCLILGMIGISYDWFGGAVTFAIVLVGLLGALRLNSLREHHDEDAKSLRAFRWAHDVYLVGKPNGEIHLEEKRPSSEAFFGAGEARITGGPHGLLTGHVLVTLSADLAGSRAMVGSGVWRVDRDYRGYAATWVVTDFHGNAIAVPWAGYDRDTPLDKWEEFHKALSQVVLAARYPNIGNFLHSNEGMFRQVAAIATYLNSPESRQTLGKSKHGQILAWALGEVGQFSGGIHRSGVDQGFLMEIEVEVERRQMEVERRQKEKALAKAPPPETT